MPPPPEQDPSAALPPGVRPPVADDPRYLGPFRLLGRLGSGGMGVVHAAVDEAGRPAAVKRVHTRLSSDSEFRARFRREISLVRRVRSDHVPQFMGAATRGAVPWLATEYVWGPTLDAEVRDRGPLEGDALSSFARGTAAALAAVHAAGVVHRDLKPGNVILSSHGPRVLDFGISRAVEEAGITRTGQAVGTPGWMPPEHYLGRAAAPAADVFSWAALVVFAATGRPPFGTGSPEVLAERVLAGGPELTGIPAVLRPVLTDCLVSEPAHRPGTDRVLDSLPGTADDTTLAEAPEGGPGPDAAGRTEPRGSTVPVRVTDQWRTTAPPRRPWLWRRRRPLAALAVVCLAAVLAGTGARLLPGRDPGAGAPEDAAEEEGQGENGAAEDVPEEYRDLYENGRVVVEQSPGDEPALVRSLTDPDSGQSLDQLRITFGDMADSWNTFTVEGTLEYLPDFGSLTVSDTDFATRGTVGPGQDTVPAGQLSISPAENTGEGATLDPLDPEAELTATFIREPRAVVFYAPDDVREGEGEIAQGFPGGLCVWDDLLAEGFASDGRFAPYDPSLGASAEAHEICPVEN